MNDEQTQLVDGYINEISAMRNRFADYIAKFELEGYLTLAENEFLYEISIACQKLADTNTIRNK